MTVRPSGAASRAASAASIRSWSVIARCVSPRAVAARTTAAGLLSESKDADVWQWRSTKERAGSVWVTAPFTASPLDALYERLAEEVEVLERKSGPESHAVERVLGDVA